ncbi:TetR family transcriptional regulator C-terminal domain-containing protein [Streptomyces coeruleorubidus]|uniref:TetR/AcrR family transcriptional regulator n=1 Tax=Streptomyces coeruleorubidus TaxID=116188 RepID=UPI00237F91A5|nr:TetR family transcriptional regulator C-terminal domain-containing protein [Streptomyces coeruleorubidus]WDV52857.1 TetR family transcriptional regulator C-terminal domain-containing protein [Streptomyces coeruleorubidus]
MPKTVDREEQRRQIGAALLQLVSDRGLDEVSVRTVAAASGRSAGAVQKYFRTKDEMLAFAAELVGERVERRMAEVDTSLPLRRALRELILTTLPVDVERRAEATTQLAFAVHAAHHPRLAAIRRQVDQDIRQALAAWLETAGHGAEAAVVIADAVIAVSDGLALRMLYTPREREHLLTVLDTALDALLSEQAASEASL